MPKEGGKLLLVSSPTAQPKNQGTAEEKEGRGREAGNETDVGRDEITQAAPSYAIPSTNAISVLHDASTGTHSCQQWVQKTVAELQIQGVHSVVNHRQLFVKQRESYKKDNYCVCDRDMKLETKSL